MKSPAKPTVAVFNSNRDLIKMIGQIFYTNGFNVLLKRIYHENNDRIKINEQLKRYKPDIVIFDIPHPYQQNWNFFLNIKNAEENTEFSFIVTTTDTNKDKIKQISEKENLIVINLPCNMNLLLEGAYKIIDIRKEKEVNPQNGKNRHSKEME